MAGDGITAPAFGGIFPAPGEYVGTAFEQFTEERYFLSGAELPGMCGVWRWWTGLPLQDLFSLEKPLPFRLEIEQPSINGKDLIGGELGVRVFHWEWRRNNRERITVIAVRKPNRKTRRVCFL